MHSRSKQSKMKNWNITHVNMKRRRKQNEIYTTKILQMSQCIDKEKQSQK